MGTHYIIVNHSTKEFVSTRLLQGYNLKRGEWVINDNSLKLMGLALANWADRSYLSQDIEWVGLDDDRGYKLMEAYEDITTCLIGAYNSEFVVVNRRSKRLHYPALWLHKLWRLKDGTVPFDSFERVIIDKEIQEDRS